jgi:hypothetical protein
VMNRKGMVVSAFLTALAARTWHVPDGRITKIDFVRHVFGTYCVLSSSIVTGYRILAQNSGGCHKKASINTSK